MEKLLNNKISPTIIGLYQAIGVVIYTVLIAGLFTLLESRKINPPDFVAAPIMLTLLVLSAGITGTLVFGLSVYLTFAKNNVKRGLAILAFTLFYLFLALILAIPTLLFFYRK